MLHTRTSGSAALELAVREAASPLQTADDLDPLLERIGDARYVLLGEATHGTSEYYLWRARISQRLIQEKGFSFIAVEGDWPDCYRVNRYVKQRDGAEDSARDVLNAFRRWPTWMWANWEIVALAEWLRGYNFGLDEANRAGFYGLDVYSLWESLTEIAGYLEQNAPDAVAAAYKAYRCFQPYGQDPHEYARAIAMVPESCEDDVVNLLVETQRRATEIQYDGDPEAAFNAEQNARVAVGAERYYRTMVYAGPESWNIRDRHMVDTLERLMRHHGRDAKAIVWEHNTHIGDARATPMNRYGMFNVGQLVREDHREDDVVLVGFGAHRGGVIAGRSWGAPRERMPVEPARAASWEDVFHRQLGEDSLLVFSPDGEADESLREVRGHRAIGVVHDPDEDDGGYVPSALADRYDAFVYLEETRALHPLHIEQATRETPPDTYPWGV